VDADQRPVPLDRLGTAADLDSSGPPRVDAGEVVDDDRRALRPLHVAVLLGLGEVAAADVDDIVLGVVGEADGTTCGVPSFPTVATRARRRSPSR